MSLTKALSDLAKVKEPSVLIDEPTFLEVVRISAYQMRIDCVCLITNQTLCKSYLRHYGLKGYTRLSIIKIAEDINVPVRTLRGLIKKLKYRIWKYLISISEMNISSVVTEEERKTIIETAQWRLANGNKRYG